MAGERLLRIDQAMVILSCSRSWAYRLVAEGRLEACRIGSGRGGLRVTESSLRAFIRQQIKDFQLED